MQKNKQYSRINADFCTGLTDNDVKLRNKQGLTNKVKKVVGKSYLQIFTSNIFTLFNFIGIVIFALMIYVCSPDNMAFFVVILANTVIGIVQEIRSKLAIEKLSIVSEPTAKVVRNGKQVTISTDEVVLDDVLLLNSGNQVCCDCIVLDGNVEVNESMLTGESVAVKKQVGDVVYSGSYVISGNCIVRADKVGKDNYVQSLTSRVKKSKAPNSQVMGAIRSIIRVLGIVIVPFGIATFFTNQTMQSACQGLTANDVWHGYWNNYGANWSTAWGNVFGTNNVTNALAFSDIQLGVNEAIKKASGSMIGMIPSGMVLLLSISFAVSALKLAQKKVLVRELPCIEMLARVDTLCLDKTGTITDGTMTVEDIITFGNVSQQQVRQYLATLLTATCDDNFTAQALNKYLQGTQALHSSVCLPFSSARKLSACTIDGVGTVGLGASEFLFDKTNAEFDSLCNKLLNKGLRVLAVGVSKNNIVNNNVTGMQPIAVVVLQDTVRSDAPEIIKWFADNDVAIKIISGDNPLSVSVIASKVGVVGADKYVSLEGMSDEQVANVANSYTVFGRVSPEQKAILVKSMKANGHTVAMTGDGVNDILAMRESDCAISVGCGTDAAKTAAHLVLSDNKFSSMPSVVAEGRQVVNNVQNSSTLFLMKTSMTIFVTLLLLFLPYNYPFEAKHLYGIELGITGIASFLLTFKPNRNIIKGKFITNILRRMVPSGIAMALSVILVYVFSGVLQLDSQQITTIAMFCSTITALCALLILLVPYDKYNVFVGVTCTLVITAVFVVCGLTMNADYSYIAPIQTKHVLFIALVCIAMSCVIVFGNKLIKKYSKD